ncbi:MAG TPA: hypothetical protein VMB79_00560 [Jatrophihabitans sp.]|nr:hypothetical protein [Jatrophihabitans sp.]
MNQPLAAPVRSRRAGLLGYRWFVLSWLAMAVSSVGSTLLLASLSAFFVVKQGDFLASALVFAVPWLFPTVASRWLARLSAGWPAVRRVPLVELSAGTMSVLTAVSASHGAAFVALGLLAVRGLPDTLTKMSRITIVATFPLDDALRRSAIYLFNTSYFLGSALGGVVGIALYGRVTVLQLGLLDLATFAVSATLYWLVARAAGSRRPAAGAPAERVSVDWPHVVGLIRTSSAQAAAVFLVLATGLLQALMFASKAAIPGVVWHQPRFILLAQVIASAGVFVGALVALPIRRLFRSSNPPAVWGALLSSALLAVAVLVRPGWELTFLASVVCFEVCFAVAQARLVEAVPGEHASVVVSRINAIGICLMLLVTVGGGVAGAHGGFRVFACAVGAFVVAAAAVVALRWPERVPPEPA